MLQIIGWLLCVYLVVKGFELVAMKSTWSNVGAAIAFIAAPIFLLLINAQATASSNPLGQLSGPTAMPGDYTSTGISSDELNAAVEADATSNAK